MDTSSRSHEVLQVVQLVVIVLIRLLLLLLLLLLLAHHLILVAARIWSPRRGLCSWTETHS